MKPEFDFQEDYRDTKCVSMGLGKAKLTCSWVEASDMNVKKKHLFFAVRVIK